MSGLTERQLFAAYGVQYDEADIPPEPVSEPRPPHVLSPLEIRQRIAAHADRMAEEAALARVRAERERVAS